MTNFMANRTHGPRGRRRKRRLRTRRVATPILTTSTTTTRGGGRSTTLSGGRRISDCRVGRKNRARENGLILMSETRFMIEKETIELRERYGVRPSSERSDEIQSHCHVQRVNRW